MRFSHRKRGITRAFQTTGPLAGVVFPYIALMFGLITGFNVSVVPASAALSILVIIADLLINKFIFVYVTTAALEDSKDDIEVYLAYLDYIPINKGNAVTYYGRRFAILSRPVLVVQHGDTFEIQGPWPIVKAMVRDIPALLQPEATPAPS